jgi:hypothetical protein
MSLLQDEAGLIALLLGAVLMGIAVIVAASLLHSRQEPTPSRGGDVRQVDPVSDAPDIVSHVAATAPTDAHMSLGVVVEALRRRLRRLARL